jgi:hypothetical protein
MASSRRTADRSSVATMASAAVILLALTMLAACSSSPSASQKSAVQNVCDAKSSLQSAVNAVQSDVSSANFGQAKDGLSKVQSAFGQLEQAAKDLKSDQQKKLQPQIDAITTNISNLKNVTSVSDLSSSLSTIGSQFQALYDDVTNTLTCP